MVCGWMGTNLEIDLSQGKIEKEEGDSQLYETYLGAKGTNAKLLWDRVPPEVPAFSPDNLLLIGTGILTGTIVPSANRAGFTFRSPQTGFHMYSSIGGLWPAEIKHAGYDTVAISGRSSTPVYLWIKDDQVAIRDAAHLWGKGIHETKKIIRAELKNKGIQIACIGPSGENRVYGATIEDGVGASASRGGIGAVMGGKNLKAIAVYGSKDVNIAKPSLLNGLCEHILQRTGPLRKWLEDFPNLLNRFDMLSGFFGNLNEHYREAPPDFKQAVKNTGVLCQELINRARTREVACYNCGIRCRQAFRRADGGYSFIKCQSWWAFMVSSKTVDYDFAMHCYNLCEDYGLDTVSVARYIAFAIELYQKGILTKKETDGMHLEWKNKEIVFSLIGKIARREGLGDVLANGVYEAARQIGNGAEEYAHHVKKLELIPASSSVFAPYFALTLAISDKADATRNMSFPTQDTWFLPKEERKAYMKSGYFVYPKEYEKYMLAEFDRTGDDYEGSCQFAVYDEETFTLTDVTGLCNFWTVFFPYPPINSRSLVASLVSSTTGIDIDEGGLTQIARRIINLIRAYNLMLGLTRKDDTVPKMFFQRTPGPPWIKLDPDKFNKLIDRFYQLRGWSSEGIPTTNTLEGLGMNYVSEELVKRGIL